MPRTYRTAEVAKDIGVHENTIRLYERLGLISQAERLPNGYRAFTDMHVAQLRLLRAALQVEVLQNGLRKLAMDILRTSAKGNLDEAEHMAERYLRNIQAERQNAEEALSIAKELLAGEHKVGESLLTRKQAADALQISIDMLRNWEMNGLLRVKRRQNGYRVYTEEELRRLKIIRTLRCANYSLAAILRMMSALEDDPQTDIREVLNTPAEGEEILSACDKLLTSLAHAEQNAQTMLSHLAQMRGLR